MPDQRIWTHKEIGKKIKKRRKELKYSQEKLAEMLGVTYQQIQRYENGTNKLNTENIQLVADALSVPLSYFFGPEIKEPVAYNSGGDALPSDEQRLLRYFRKINDMRSRNLVIHVARIAAK